MMSLTYFFHFTVKSHQAQREPAWLVLLLLHEGGGVPETMLLRISQT